MQLKSLNRLHHPIPNATETYNLAIVNIMPTL